MKGFQAGVLIFFGIFLFLGVLIFSGAIKLPKKASTASAPTGTIIIWGVIPKASLSTGLDVINTSNPALSIRYVEKDPRTYEADLLNAYAFGGLPDLFLLPQSLIQNYKDKIVHIPFTYLPERTYDDTYVRAANIFKTTDGYLGFPIFSDPLVMYYNQDLLEAANFSTPPKYWSDLFDYIPKLTQKNDALKISVSGTALGEFSNIKNAKQIFSALMLQLDNSIVALDANNLYQPILNSSSNVSLKPAVQSINFYNEFSDPVRDVYSWNKSLKNSQDAFVGGELAIYFGLASEYSNISQKNPNLNFDVAMLPQVKELSNIITYADMYALAIPSTSPNAQVALSVAADLANGANTWTFVAPSGFSPVRRDLIASTGITKYMKVFFDSSLNSRSWVDPNDVKTTEIFTRAEESILSGLSTPDEAIQAANTDIEVLLYK